MHRIHTLPNDEAKLRRVAKKVKNPQHPSIKMLAEDMIRIAEAWEVETGGRCEGLAAPQIGVNLQVVILRKTDFNPPRKPVLKDALNFLSHDERVAYLEELSKFEEFEAAHPNYCNWHVAINTRFRHSEGVQESEEGCLSVPGKLGKVVRPNVVIFDYVDVRGIRVGPFRTKDQLSAACITHEIDHLKGNLYCDNALIFMDADKFREAIERQRQEAAEAAEAIMVTDEDAARLDELVKNPPEPTEALRELMSEGEAVAEG